MSVRKALRPKAAINVLPLGRVAREGRRPLWLARFQLQSLCRMCYNFSHIVLWSAKTLYREFWIQWQRLQWQSITVAVFLFWKGSSHTENHWMLWQSATVTLMIIPTSVAVTEFLCTQPRDGVLATYEMQTLGCSQTTFVTIDPEFVRKLSSDQIGVKWGGSMKISTAGTHAHPFVQRFDSRILWPISVFRTEPFRNLLQYTCVHATFPALFPTSLLFREMRARLRERWRATPACMQNAKFAMGRTMLWYPCISIQRPSRACFEGFCEWGLL